MIADRARMSRIARSFPTLARGAPIDVFDPEALDAWACSGAATSGSSAAARFILSVWSGSTGALDAGEDPSKHVWCWRSRRFELHEALGYWDDAHRAAFRAWARDPWWP